MANVSDVNPSVTIRGALASKRLAQKKWRAISVPQSQVMDRSNAGGKSCMRATRAPFGESESLSEITNGREYETCPWPCKSTHWWPG